MEFKVRGVTYNNRQRIIKKILKSMVDEYMVDKYDGMTNKEIKESYDKVFEFEDVSFHDVLLEKEDDNEHDGNAVKVLIADAYGEYHHVGYVPKEKCLSVRRMIDNNNYSIRADLTGGRYKEVDYDDYGEEIIQTFDLNYGINIVIEKKKETDNTNILSENELTEKQLDKQNKWEERAKKLEEVGKNMENIGQKTTQIGCALTLMLTLPILGLLFFGVFGFIIGGAIGLLGIIGIFSNKKK